METDIGATVEEPEAMNAGQLDAPLEGLGLSHAFAEDTMSADTIHRIECQGTSFGVGEGKTERTNVSFRDI